MNIAINNLLNLNGCQDIFPSILAFSVESQYSILMANINNDFSNFWSSQIVGLNCDIMFIPINTQSIHWTLLMINTKNMENISEISQYSIISFLV